MTETSGVRCERADEVTGLALRALPEAERPAFEAHLAECSACRRELATFRSVVDALVDWPTDVLRPPRPLWDRLAERIGGDSGGASPAEAEARWPDQPAWSEVAPGIECKLLAVDAATGRVSMLVRLAPGAAYPPHVHADLEELHLLDGELWIDARKLRPGDYHRAEPGSEDVRVWSETGCSCVLLTSSHDVLR